MALITWSNELSVNIETIDQQHQKLINMINEFYDEITKKSNKELIAELIHKMKAYATEHFRAEEKLFKELDYDDVEDHIKQHEHFIKKVENLEQRYKNGKLILSIEITEFLKNWLVNHIQKIDIEYAKQYS